VRVSREPFSRRVPRADGHQVALARVHGPQRTGVAPLAWSVGVVCPCCQEMVSPPGSSLVCSWDERYVATFTWWAYLVLIKQKDFSFSGFLVTQRPQSTWQMKQ
jgi:hypothetical protein